MELFRWIAKRHRAKKAEQEAIERAADEMHRAGEEEKPQEGIGASVYAWIKSDG